MIFARNATTLASENRIPCIDDRIRFEEEGHAYFVRASCNDEWTRFHGKSVTGIVASQFDGETFVPDHVIAKYYENWKSNPNSKYYHIIRDSASQEQAAENIKLEWRKAFHNNCEKKSAFPCC